MTNMLVLAAIILVIVILIVIVLMERAQLRIPTIILRKRQGCATTHLLLKINSAGVIPAFSLARSLQHQMISSRFVTVDRTNPWMDFLVQLFDQTVYGVIFTLSY